MGNDFQKYLKAQTERESAYHLYNYASVKLDKAKISERAAEVVSQHKPFHSRLDELMPDSKLKKDLTALMFDTIEYILTGKQS